MGIFSLIPSSSLEASYSGSLSTLYISASGDSLNYTSGIEFSRDSNDPCSYRLEGWVGPRASGTTPFKIENKFQSQVPVSGYIKVYSATYPAGTEVKISWLSEGEKTPKLPSVEKAYNGTQNGNNNKDYAGAGNGVVNSHKSLLPPPQPVKISALYKESFDIVTSTRSWPNGRIDVKFDSRFLIIEDAGYENGNIAWTFNSLQTGNTQVFVNIVTESGLFLQKTYDVRIFVLGAITASDISTNPDAILSFLGRVNIAVNIVRRQWPVAELLEVDAKLPTGDSNPTTNPLSLSQLRAVFNIPTKKSNGTVIINSTGWGEWGQPSFSEYPWAEDIAIPWPNGVKGLDITGADQYLKKAGFTGPFWNCTLRHPLGPGGPGYDQPYYIFGLSSGPYVFVGVDGTVLSNPTGQKKVPEKVKV